MFLILREATRYPFQIRNFDVSQSSVLTSYNFCIPAPMIQQLERTNCTVPNDCYPDETIPDPIQRKKHKRATHIPHDRPLSFYDGRMRVLDHDGDPTIITSNLHTAMPTTPLIHVGAHLSASSSNLHSSEAHKPFIGRAPAPTPPLPPAANTLNNVSFLHTPRSLHQSCKWKRAQYIMHVFC